MKMFLAVLLIGVIQPAASVIGFDKEDPFFSFFKKEPDFKSFFPKKDPHAEPHFPFKEDQHPARNFFFKKKDPHADFKFPIKKDPHADFKFPHKKDPHADFKFPHKKDPHADFKFPIKKDPHADFKFPHKADPHFDPHFPTKIDPHFDPHFPTKIDPHFDPHFPTKIDPHDPHFPNVKDLERRTSNLVSGQKKIINFLGKLKHAESDFKATLAQFDNAQKKNDKLIDSIAGLAVGTKENLKDIRGNQSTILKGQDGIHSLIQEEHKKTRISLGQMETRVESDLSNVRNRQEDIQDSLQESQDALAQGFASLEEAEKAEQELLNKALQTVVENAEANAQGQGSITEEIQQTTEDLVKSTQNIQKTQDGILNRISSLTSSEVHKLKKVLAKQTEILSEIESSQTEIQKDIGTSVAIEKQTQGIVEENERVAVKGLEEVQNSQSQTQHLAKKCREAAECDLSEVNKGLVDISAIEAAFAKSVRRDLKAVRERQSQTQKLVGSSEKNILEAIDKSFDQVDEAIPEVKSSVLESGGKVKSQLKNIENNVNDTKESQASTLAFIKEILDIVADLGKLGGTKFFHHG